MTKDGFESVIYELLAKYDFFNISGNESKARMYDVIVGDIVEALGITGESVIGYLEEYGFDELFQRNNSFSYKISLKEVFDEYCANFNFRDIISSRNFRYIEDFLILDNADYIREGMNGNLVLTDYAKNHLDECAIYFDTNYLVHSDKSDLFYDGKTGKNKPKYTSEENAKILESIGEIKKDFDDRYEVYAKTARSLSELLLDFLSARKWGVKDFTGKTGLDERTFYRIKSDSVTPTIETLLTISIGLRLSTREREALFTSAGCGYKKTKKHFAYEFIFDTFHIETVDDFNNIYLELGIDTKAPLKSHGATGG